MEAKRSRVDGYTGDYTGLVGGGITKGANLRCIRHIKFPCYHLIARAEGGMVPPPQKKKKTCIGLRL